MTQQSVEQVVVRGDQSFHFLKSGKCFLFLIADNFLVSFKRSNIISFTYLLPTHKLTVFAFPYWL